MNVQFDNGGHGCNNVSAWLRRLISGAPVRDVPVAEREHLEACPLCRARLFLCLESLAAHFNDIDSAQIDCAHCEDWLGAYIETEQADAARAMRQFPAIAWHIWTCPDCLELYTLMSGTLSDPALRIDRFLPKSAAQEGLRHSDAGVSSSRFVLQLKRAALKAALPSVMHATPDGRMAYRFHGGSSPSQTFAVLGATLVADGQSRYSIEAEPKGASADLIIRLDSDIPGFVLLTGATAPLICAAMVEGKAVLNLPEEDIRNGAQDAFTILFIPSSDLPS